MSKFKKKSDPFSEREAQKYEHPIPSREYILEYLAERGKPATYDQVIEELHIESEDELEAMRRRLIAMVRDGQLYKNRKGCYGPAESMELIPGRVIGHKDGFGFVEPDDGSDDLFLTPRQMQGVFHGDRVLVRVTGTDRRNRREAMLVQILEHNTQQLVGRFYSESGASYVEPSNQRIGQRILIPPSDTRNATNGQIVVVAVISQPTKNTLPLGEVLEILGDHMAPGMEINIAIRNHGLPLHWPEDVLLEAGKYPPDVSEKEKAEREDFRKLPFVTIDGEDAKDFDDAVYCEARPKGGWKLYVAIADVSHYVRSGTALDKEAYQRGNSVYFPGRVIPMLPESLSNNLCSLRPKVDRLVMVCEMTIHESGRITRYQFHEGIIHSHERLTYNQVHAMIEKKDRRMREKLQHVVPHLEELYALFHVLRAARTERGAIDFDMPETKIVYGQNRKIEKIVPYERFDSHRVIEECMLCANISAARYLAKNKQSGLYRVHEGPTEEKFKDLLRFTKEMGLNMPGHRLPVPADYAHILRVTQDRADAQMIQTVLLRSMQQAIYSPDNRGHFGLAYDAYAHFTSPIRRYPDLLVHRAIRHVLRGKPSLLEDAALAVSGKHCSMTERRADDATREAVDWLKCEFMMDKVGKEYTGRISGVTSFGLFVELDEVYVEGLIHISTLPGDYYQFEALKHALVGERSGKRYSMGDKIKIQVARVDLDQCVIDFILAGMPPQAKDSARGRAKEKSNKSSKSRGPKTKKPEKKRKKPR